jgi:hypothetical protein
LLDPAEEGGVDAAQSAYAAELAARGKALLAMQGTLVGQRSLAQEQTARKRRALAMFPGAANPLPLLARR